jgi:hypothetical protein
MYTYWYVVLPVQVWTLIRSCWILKHQLVMVLFKVTFGKEKGFQTQITPKYLPNAMNIMNLVWRLNNQLCESGTRNLVQRSHVKMQNFMTFTALLYFQQIFAADHVWFVTRPGSLITFMKTQLWNHADFGLWPETETIFVERMVKVFFVLRQTVDPKGVLIIKVNEIL